MEKKKYIEIIKMSGNVVIKRMDVTVRADRQIERIESGVNINLNHNEFFTDVNEYDKEMPDSDEVNK
jgi:hypothetical protein